MHFRPLASTEELPRWRPPEPRRIDPSAFDALNWLARHQSADGSWPSQPACCRPNPVGDDHEAGLTALALLAFLRAGIAHTSPEPHGRVVRRGLQWLIAQQDAEGCIGRSGRTYMINHALATFALAEAYRWTGSYTLVDAARKAADFLVEARTPGAGWRYQSACFESDSFVTAWAVAALRSAELAGLVVPTRSYNGARAWFESVTDDDMLVGYTVRGRRHVFVPGRSEVFNHHEALTAAAVVARVTMDHNKSDVRLMMGCQAIAKDTPAWKDLDIDYMYWYWGTLALWTYDGPSGTTWKRWHAALKTALADHQIRDGCKRGSWEPVDRWSMDGGRVYATAINALTLLVSTRFR